MKKEIKPVLQLRAMASDTNKPNPLQFIPVILVCLGLIGFGLYKNFHKVFDIRRGMMVDYYNPNREPVPTPIVPATSSASNAASSAKLIPTAADAGKTITRAILNTNCQIEVTTDKKDYNISAEGLVGDCKNEQLGKISPSGDVLAFTGTFARTASLLKLFILNYEKSVTLGSWKEGDIKDYIFLPDGMMVVLINIQGDTTLEVYDLTLITQDFSEIFNVSSGYITPGKRHGSIYLPVANGRTLSFNRDKIQVLGEEKNVLAQVDPQTIILESHLTTISPAKAQQMVLNFYKEYETGTGSKAVFDWAGSTDLSWKINITGPGNKNVKQYMVNSSTGEIK